MPIRRNDKNQANIRDWIILRNSSAILCEDKLRKDTKCVTKKGTFAPRFSRLGAGQIRRRAVEILTIREKRGRFVRLARSPEQCRDGSGRRVVPSTKRVQLSSRCIVAYRATNKTSLLLYAIPIVKAAGMRHGFSYLIYEIQECL